MDALVAFRLPKKITTQVDELAEEEDRDRSALLRELISLGMREKTLGKAVKLYAQGRVTAWKAASLAGISLWEFIDVLRDHKIEAQYGLKELEEDLEALH